MPCPDGCLPRSRTLEGGFSGQSDDSVALGSLTATATASAVGRLKTTLKAFSRKVARSLSLRSSTSGSMSVAGLDVPMATGPATATATANAP